MLSGARGHEFPADLADLVQDPGPPVNHLAEDRVEEPVPHQGSAELAIQLDPVGRLRAGLGDPQVGAVEAPGLPAGAKTSLHPVAPRAGHDVDQATLKVPVFRAGAESADLDLLDPAGAGLEKISSQPGMIHRD